MKILSNERAKQFNLSFFHKVAALLSTASILVSNYPTLAQNVGVGTVSPTSRLHIIAPSGFSSPLLKIEMEGASSSFLTIQPDGKVGIGTNTPSQTLEVAGNIQFSGALMPNGNAGTAGQVLVSQGPGNPPQWQSVGAGGAAGICSSPMANYVQKWTGTELCNSLIYDDGTNVGIGTNTPTHTLHVTGSTYIQDSLRIDGDFRPGGNPGMAGQFLVSQGPGNPPTWQNLVSGAVFTDTLSTVPLYTKDSVVLTIPGLAAGQTIFIIGDGTTYNHDYSSDRVELELYHNGTLLTRRRFQTIVAGASGYKYEDLTIMGVATATAGTNTIKVIVNVINTGSSVQVQTFRLTAIVF